ncbi:MAG: HAD hydrolase-like protein [bacterium]|nr:HAD hydrolase-like protein [bacterium]
MQNNKIKFVITDVDGVVFDRMPIFQTTFVEMMFRHYGIQKDFAAKYYYDTAGIPLQGQSGQLVGILQIHNISFTAEDIDRFVREFIQIAYKGEPKIFPGVKEILIDIKKSGRDLLASSGSPTSELKTLFAKYNLPYDFFLGSDKILKGDKHIELFANHFSLTLGEFCQKALLIGDGPADMGLAKRNGIFAVGITNTVSAEKLLVSGASVVIESIDDIFDYL